MDILHLKKKVTGLVAYMKDVGYTSQYIWYVNHLTTWIVSNSMCYKWQNYADIEHTLAELWHNKHTFANKSRLLRIIQRYDEEGSLPNGRKHYQKPSRYDQLYGEFKEAVDIAFKSIGKDIKMAPTIKVSMSSFFFDLQEHGIDSLVAIDEEAVQMVFSPNGTPTRSHTFKYSVEYGLKKCVPYYKGGIIERIISYLPAIPNSRKNIQYLTETEIKAIKHVLEHDKTISLQDKAIATIALYTGLRSCDISALTMKDFDWEGDLIVITQSKTGTPLTLPLRAVVGNAVYDYLTKERPKCDEPYVFLTVNPPHRRFHTSNLNAICVKIMHKAGIRLKASDRKGLHLFRHYVATSLIQSGVQQPVISATLGHSSPESLNPYLNAGFKRLKECALSIEDYPVRKEVFYQ
jgi:integrase